MKNDFHSKLHTLRLSYRSFDLQKIEKSKMSNSKNSLQISVSFLLVEMKISFFNFLLVTIIAVIFYYLRWCFNFGSIFFSKGKSFILLSKLEIWSKLINIFQRKNKMKQIIFSRIFLFLTICRTQSDEIPFFSFFDSRDILYVCDWSIIFESWIVFYAI